MRDTRDTPGLGQEEGSPARARGAPGEPPVATFGELQ